MAMARKREGNGSRGGGVRTGMWPKACTCLAIEGKIGNGVGENGPGHGSGGVGMVCVIGIGVAHVWWKTW